MKGLRAAVSALALPAGVSIALWAAILFSAPAAADAGHPASCEGLGNARETAKFQHDQLRCTKVGDVGACDDALRAKPNDPQLMIAKGDALLHGGRAADAVLVYRHVRELQRGEATIKTKIAAAESQRQALVQQCEGTADAAAVDACQAALLHGTPDEFVLLKRKGILLQSMDRADPALDAFIAAAVIRQDDRSVALAIVALSDRTGRTDALALAARGSALLTLGRATQSLQALQQAQTLAPALPGIKAQLTRAEAAAREEVKRKPRVANIYSNDAEAAHTN